MKIEKEIGNREGEGTAYGNLGNSYQSLGDYGKAIEFHGKHLKIAKKIGDRGGKQNANGNLGNAYDSLGAYRKAIQFHEKHLKIAKKKSVMGLEKQEPMEISVMLTSHWVTIEKQLSFMKNI